MDYPSAPAGAATRFLVRPDDAIDFSALRRVLVVMLRHHGDVLLTSPIYSVLKSAAREAEIDALIYRETLPMLAFNPDLAQVHTIDRRWKKQGLRAQLAGEWGLLQALKSRRYDLVVHLTNHRRGAWLTRLLAPRWSVGPKLREQSGFWRAGFTHLYPSSMSVGSGSPLGHRHVVEQNLDALRRLGLAIPQAPGLTMVAGPEGERDADTFLAAKAVGADYILVQPTSRWLFKCWSVERNADLIRALLARGETVVLSCAPDVRERAMVRAIVERISRGDEGDASSKGAFMPTPEALTPALSQGEREQNDGRLSLPLEEGQGVRGLLPLPPGEGWGEGERRPGDQRPGPLPEALKLADDGGTLNRLAALIGHAKLFIGIDSAPMHIAAAMGTPAVAMFGPSSELSWGPWSGTTALRYRVVTSDAHPCRPCGQDGCGGGKISECLTSLPVARVLAAADELLAGG